MVLPDSIRDSAWYAITDDDWPRVKELLRDEDRQARGMRCAAEVAAVRAEPDDSAEQVTQVLRGEPIQVEEQTGRPGRESGRRTGIPAGCVRRRSRTGTARSFRTPTESRSTWLAPTSVRRISGVA